MTDPKDTEDIPSGCIGVCSTLFDAICKGCGRTQAEVENWIFMTADEKRAAVKRAEEAGVGIRFENPPI